MAVGESVHSPAAGVEKADRPTAGALQLRAGRPFFAEVA
jgi:hypothetical protein